MTFEAFKAHTRTTGFDRDDDYLEGVLAAAEAYVIDQTGFTQEEWAAVPDELFPAPLKHAILLLGGAMYAYRESVDTVQLHPNMIFQALLKPYQKMNGGSITERLLANPTGQQPSGGARVASDTDVNGLFNDSETQA